MSPPQDHDYLSTGCFHGDHGYCASMTGLVGAKRPATCKFCGAQCRCRCHGEATDPWPLRAPYRIYSRWVRAQDRSARSVWAAIQEAYTAGHTEAAANGEGFQLPVTPPVPSFDQEGTP